MPLEMSLAARWYPRALAAVALTLAAAASSASYAAGALTLLQDASAHLNVARRIIDSLTPGMAQIGAQWLPLQHLLLLPFVAFDGLWHTGAASVALGALCVLCATLAVYGGSRELGATPGRAALAGVLVAGNANLLYLQSAAMPDPLLLATAAATCYYLVRLVRTGRLQNLLLAGFCCYLATLTSYVGWALCATAAGLVYVYGRSLRRDDRLPEAYALAFLAMAGHGVLFWLIYNRVMFNDWFFFLRVRGVALAASSVARPGLGEVLASYGWAVGACVGWAVTAAGALGLVVFVVRRALGDGRSPLALAALLFLAPAAAMALALAAGLAVIGVPSAPLNARFGLLALPGLALFAGFAPPRNTLGNLGLTLIIAIQAALFAGLGLSDGSAAPSASLSLLISRNPVLLEALEGADGAAGATTQPEDVAWFSQHYDRGLVLIDDTTNPGFVQRANLDFSLYVTTASPERWGPALNRPDRAVRWIVALQRRPDRVWLAFRDVAALKDTFTEAYRRDDLVIFRNNDPRVS